MFTKIRKLAAKVTRRRVWWFCRTTLQSWLVQGTLFAVLALSGVGTVSALVSAKVASYAVWAGQVATAARSE